MKPTCNDEYVLNKDKCLCEPPKKASPKKVTPKKGSPKKCTKRNPPADKDGYCDEKKPYYYDGCCYVGKKNHLVDREYKVRTVKKSPEKQRIKIKKPKTLKKLIIKNTTPDIDKTLSKLTERNEDKSVKRDEIIKSFSPDINSSLSSISSNDSKTYSVMSNYATPLLKNIREDQKGKSPGSDVRYDMVDKKINELFKNPHVYDIDGNKHGYKSKKAIDILLNNLYNRKEIDCTKVIAPIQWQSNCWFNCGFMINFISDKGRKFTKFFREAMITGSILSNQKNRKKIRPSSLQKAFFVFNLCIESSISGNKLAYFLDTNLIIREIYKSLPAKFKKVENVAKTSIPANPSTYYKSIFNYLIREDDIPTYTTTWNIYDNSRFSQKINSLYKINKYDIPDIIKVSVYDNNTNENPGKNPAESGNVNNKPLKFTIADTNGNKYSYELDSVLIRDTSARHFCCVLTCQKSEYGFDGESFHRMSKFSWKNLINTNKDWKFEGSHVYWNFMNGYQELNYYRVK